MYVNKSDIPKNVHLIDYYKVACGQSLRRDKQVVYNIAPVKSGTILSQSFPLMYASKNPIETTRAYKYIKTSFFRFLVQAMTDEICTFSPARFKLVPLQDFTDKSDIDWSKSINEIDLQLCKKYGLTDDEIRYIAETIKPMS